MSILSIKIVFLQKQPARIDEVIPIGVEKDEGCSVSYNWEVGEKADTALFTNNCVASFQPQIEQRFADRANLCVSVGSTFPA